MNRDMQNCISLVVRLNDRPIESISAKELGGFRVSLLNQKQKIRGKQVIDEPLTEWYVRGVLKTVRAALTNRGESRIIAA